MFHSRTHRPGVEKLPCMTLDHVVLTVVWKASIFAGSIFKDKRLRTYIGQCCVEYPQRVAGYPWIVFGSLGKWPME